MADRGLRVTAVDFAEPAVERARAHAGDDVRVLRADVRDLPFDDGSFAVVLAWAVLMHVPEAERGLAELCRVLAPGGALILGEGNRRSLDVAWKRRRRVRGRTWRSTPQGLERWTESAAGAVMTREFDTRWLAGACAANGLRPRRPRVGEFTEAYSAFAEGSLPERAVHAFNRLWFRRVGVTAGATGIFLVADRPAR
jgi:SAM-dependent methyltransferase